LQLPKTSGLAVWLLPGSDQSHLFSRVISDVAEQYNSIPFLPHITLSTVPDLSTRQVIGLTSRLCAELNQVHVDVKKMECRDHPYRKVVLTIDDEVMLNKFSVPVNRVFNGTFCKQSDFHISLLYGNHKCEEIELGNIRRELESISKLYIQSMAVVDLNFTPDKWKIIFEQDL